MVASEWRDVWKNLTATRYPIDQAVLAAGPFMFRVVVILPIVLAVFLVFNQVRRSRGRSISVNSTVGDENDGGGQSERLRA